RELSVNYAQVWIQVALAIMALLVLILLFSQDYKLAFSVIVALLAVLAISVGLALGLLRLSGRLAGNAGSIWRLALANLQRRRGQSVVQIVVFATAIMLLLTLAIVRTSLIEEWQMQLPDKAPNHFLVNIPAHEVATVQALIDEEGYSREPLYPMVRGRVTHINDIEPSDELRDGSGVLRREANLTWSDVIGSDNKIVAGEWWDTWQPKNTGLPGVSIEAEMAKNVGLEIGDRIRFSLGGL